MRRILPIATLLLFVFIHANGQDGRAPGQQELPGKIIKTYPNPATTYITFDLQKNHQEGLTIVVYSFLGRKMYENQNVPEKTTLNLSEFTRGVYVYHLRDQGGKVIDTGKFQVSR